MININIYTDGACSGNGGANSKGGFGALFKIDGFDTFIALYGGKYGATNNGMELEACIQALKAIPRKKRYGVIVNLYSDSAYVVNCFLQKWYVNWAKNKWTNSKGKPVSNASQWRTLLAITHDYKAVNFHKVEGHSDNKFNNKADELAVRGSKELNLPAKTLKGTRLEEI